MTQTMEATFHGATEDELRDREAPRSLTAMVDQRRLFPHSGTANLDDERLTLGTWLALEPDDVRSVARHFTDAYSRVAAGGARGGFPSFGFFGKHGEPVILTLTDGVQLYLLFGFVWLWGTTDNEQWYEKITAWHRS